MFFYLLFFLAEKEAAREAKLREAEEKKLRRQAAEEERKLKAAERDAKKRKISGDFQGIATFLIIMVLLLCCYLF